MHAAECRIGSNFALNKSEVSSQVSCDQYLYTIHGKYTIEAILYYRGQFQFKIVYFPLIPEYSVKNDTRIPKHTRARTHTHTHSRTLKLNTSLVLCACNYEERLINTSGN